MPLFSLNSDLCIGKYSRYKVYHFATTSQTLGIRKFYLFAFKNSDIFDLHLDDMYIPNIQI